MQISVFFAALSAVVIFGGSAVATKIAVADIAALDVSFLRTLLGGLITLPLVYFLKIKLPETKKQKLLLSASGFSGFIAFPILFTYGVNLTSANHATMILATLPIITGAIAMLWDRQMPAVLWWVGCSIAFVGEVALIYQPETNSIATIEGDLLVLIANFFAAIGYVTGARLQRSGYSAKGTTFWGIILFAIVLLPIAPFILDIGNLSQTGLIPWSAVLYQAVGVTIIAYILWYWALGTGGIARVGLFQFLQPVSGIILASLLLAEPLTSGFLIASAIIMSGLLIAFKAR